MWSCCDPQYLPRRPPYPVNGAQYPISTAATPINGVGALHQIGEGAHVALLDGEESPEEDDDLFAPDDSLLQQPPKYHLP